MSNTNNRKAETIKEISIKELLSIVYRRIWLVAIIVIGCILFTYFRTSDPAPVYQSSSRLIIEASGEKMQTLQVIIKDVIVLEKVVEKLQLPTTPEALANQISVSTIGTSEVVSITATNTDPEIAASIANTTAQVFREEVTNISGFEGVRNLSPAKVNNVPINNEGSSSLLTAALMGLVIGVGLTFLLNSFDYTIRTQQEIEEYVGIPLVGQVSKMNKRSMKSKGRMQKTENSKTIDKQSMKIEI